MVPSFQQRAFMWLNQCFGNDPHHKETYTDAVAGLRFFEEATELLQSIGVSQKDLISVIEYVYNRPVGDPPQEVAGVMLTLACFSSQINVNMHQVAETELVKMSSPEKMEKLRNKQHNKPKIST